MSLAQMAETAQTAKMIEEDDESDIDSDEENERQILQLQEQVKESPRKYELHLQLVTLLRQNAELDQLRVARKEMAKIFPLPPDFWMQWIGDEKRLVKAIGECQVDEIFELYTKASQDYLNVPMWLSSMEFAQESYPNEPEEIRLWFERAVACCGWHTSEGHKVWELYREFEKSIPDNEDDTKTPPLIERLRALYKKELSAPLIGMDRVMSEYINWERTQEGKQPPDDLFEVYGMLKSELDACMPYEQKLAELGSPSSAGCASADLLAAWEEYIVSMSARNGESRPTQCIVLLERAVAQCFLSPQPWLRYLQFLAKFYSNAALMNAIFIRALRNCPFSGLLWEAYVRFLDRQKKKTDEVEPVLEKAMARITSPDEKMLPLLAFASTCRRVAGLGRVGFTPTRPSALPYMNKLKEVLQRMNELLPRCYYDDTHHSVYSFQLHIYAKCLGDIKHAEELCETWVLTRPQDHRSWLAYIQLQQCQPGSVSHTRVLFKRAQGQVPFDWRGKILAREWMAFERAAGNIADYDAALVRSEPLLGWGGAIGAGVSSAGARGLPRHSEKQGDGEHGSSWESFKGRQPGGKFNRDKNKKRKREEDKKIKRELKEKKKKERKEKKENRLRKELNEQTEEKGDDDISTQPTKKQKISDTDQQAPECTEKMTEDKQSDTQEQEQKKLSEDYTVFVLNLPWNVTDKEIQKAFQKIGPVAGVRHVRNYKGFSKGYAYVDFVDKQHVPKAIAALDGKELKGRIISVSLSKPPGKRQAKSENKTVFLKNLPQLEASELDLLLRAKFQPCGDIHEIRWARDRTGKLKRFCYLEFKSDESAVSALELNNTRLGKEISANDEKESPSGETEEKETDETPTDEKMIDQAAELSTIIVVEKSVTKDKKKKKNLRKEKMMMRSVGKARSHIKLLPRSVRLSSASSSASSLSSSSSASASSSSGEVVPAPKSNADFRKMFGLS